MAGLTHYRRQRRLTMAAIVTLLAVGAADMVAAQGADVRFHSDEARELEKSGLRLVPNVAGLVQSATISDGGDVLATGTRAGLMLWNVHTERVFRRIPVRARLLDLSSSGRTVIAADGNFVSVWDVATGELIHRDRAPGALSVRLRDEREALVCNSSQCVSYVLSGGFTEYTIHDLPEEGWGGVDVSSNPRGQIIASVDVDGSFVWANLDDGTVYSGSFGIEGGQVFPISIAVINDSIAIIGMSNGVVFSWDVHSKVVLGILDVKDEVDDQVSVVDIAYIDDKHVAVGAGWQVLIVSLDDLAVVERVYPWGSEPRFVQGYSLASSVADRRLVVQMISGVIIWDLDHNALVSMLHSAATVPIRVEFGSNRRLLVDAVDVASVWDLEQGKLLQQFRHGAPSNSIGAYDVATHTQATLIDETLVYVPLPAMPPMEQFVQGIAGIDDTIPKTVESWSTERGRATVAGIGEFVGPRETVGTVRAVGSDIAVGLVRPFGVDRHGRELLNYDYDITALLLGALGSADPDVLRLEFPEGIEWFRFDGDSDRIALDRGADGLEILRGSDGKRIWRRADLRDIDRVMAFSDDQSSVVVTTLHNDFLSRERQLEVDLEELWGANPPDHSHRDHEWDEPHAQLIVLDAETGETRFSEEIIGLDDVSRDAVLQGIDRLARGYAYERVSFVPVLGSGRVHGMLRLQEGQVQRVSVRADSVGSIIDIVDLGISTLAFAVTDRDGDLYLVADGAGTMVLWNIRNGSRTTLVSATDSTESVAISPDGRLLALAERDGTVHLWDISDVASGIRKLARLVTFSNGDWAVVRDDGRYDASDPADLGGLVWVMPNAPTDPVPLAIFYRDHYEPWLLSRLIRGEEFPPVVTIAELDRNQPRVEIIELKDAGQGRVDVILQVERASADGVGDVKVFRDGRLVGLDESVQREDTNDSWRLMFSDVALPTRSSKEFVEFSTYAFNADGVKSETDRLPYRLPDLTPRSRRAFVVVVGVDAYENQSWDLRYAADDAKLTRDLITAYLRASDVFDEIHAVSLIAERDDATRAVSGHATRADFLAVIDALAGRSVDMPRLARIPGADSLSKAHPDDLVFLAFSGHGLSGAEGLFHLFLHDIGEGDEREVGDVLLRSTLTSDLLAERLRPVDAGSFVIVIDACNAAASVQGKGFRPGPMGSRGLGQLAYDKAMRVLAASQAEDIALESAKLRHGLLTYAMLHEGLSNRAADRAPEDRWIDLHEILQYAVERVPVLYREILDGSFVAAGRGLSAFRPVTEQFSPKVQQPSLFDFSRGEHNLRIQIVKSDDGSPN